MYRLAVALRYLRKRRVTLFPIAGVAIGVMTLVVVMSVMKGYDAECRRQIRGSNPDVTVTFLDMDGYSAASREELERLVRAVESVQGVAAVSPYLSGDCIVTTKQPARNGNMATDTNYAKYKGIDFNRECAVTNLRNTLKRGGDPLAGSEYGREGSQAKLIMSPDALGWYTEDIQKRWEPSLDKAQVTLSTLTADWEAKTLAGKPADVLKRDSGHWEFPVVYLPIDWARALSRLGPDSLSGIGVKLAVYDSKTAAAAKKDIAKALEPFAEPGTYSVESWEDQQRAFLAIVAMQRSIMGFILFFFLVVAGFSITAILILIVLEKVRDIGVMQAMGSSARGIAEIFLAYGVAIGAAGSAAGVALGILIVRNIDHVEAAARRLMGLRLPDVAPRIPTLMDWSTNAWIVVTALAVSFAAGLLPAIKAARMDPVEAIRHE